MRKCIVPYSVYTLDDIIASAPDEAAPWQERLAWQLNVYQEDGWELVGIGYDSDGKPATVVLSKNTAEGKAPNANLVNQPAAKPL